MLHLTPETLSRPPEETVRLLAGSHLKDANRAFRRLQRGRDPEALHDLRVGLRRLRTLFRAYRPYFEDTVTKKTRKRLRKFAGWTGAGRDAEVQAEWLRARKSSMTGWQRPGVALAGATPGAPPRGWL